MIDPVARINPSTYGKRGTEPGWITKVNATTERGGGLPLAIALALGNNPHWSSASPASFWSRRNLRNLAI